MESKENNNAYNEAEVLKYQSPNYPSTVYIFFNYRVLLMAHLLPQKNSDITAGAFIHQPIKRILIATTGSIANLQLAFTGKVYSTIYRCLQSSNNTIM